MLVFAQLKKLLLSLLLSRENQKLDFIDESIIRKKWNPKNWPNGTDTNIIFTPPVHSENYIHTKTCKICCKTDQKYLQTNISCLYSSSYTIIVTHIAPLHHKF